MTSAVPKASGIFAAADFLWGNEFVDRHVEVAFTLSECHCSLDYSNSKGIFLPQIEKLGWNPLGNSESFPIFPPESPDRYAYKQWKEQGAQPPCIPKPVKNLGTRSLFQSMFLLGASYSLCQILLEVARTDKQINHMHLKLIVSGCPGFRRGKNWIMGSFGESSSYNVVAFPKQSIGESRSPKRIVTQAYNVDFVLS